MLRMLSRLALVICLLGTLAACDSSRPKDKWVEARQTVYPAGGVVTLDGIPLAGATVTFRPAGDGVACAGITDEKGAFQMTTYETFDGATEGEFLVTVSKFEVPVPPANYNADTMPPLPAPKLITPGKYAEFEKSGLTVKVGKGEPNRFEFSLNSK